MTTCAKDGTISDFKSSRKTAKEYERKSLLSQKMAGNKFQGDIGEMIAATGIVENLELLGVHFDPPEIGLDAAYEDKNGNLVLVESKMAESGLRRKF